jgi:hypothetical protein
MAKPNTANNTPNSSNQANPAQPPAPHYTDAQLEAMEAKLLKGKPKAKLCHPDFTAASGQPPVWVRAYVHLAFTPGWALAGKWVDGQPGTGYPHTADGRPFVQVNARYQTRQQAEGAAHAKAALAALTPAQRAAAKAQLVQQAKVQRAAQATAAYQAAIANGMDPAAAQAQMLAALLA